MQGRMNGNLERKGPHKSMHCKFCKPPGVVYEDKTPYPQLETKTKIRLVHEGADLTVYDVHDEPGVPAVEHEACICVLEGDKTCPKCMPDKNKPPQKKKVCRCPKGAKPHPSMYQTAPARKKEVHQDDEFWWEKYSREHDAITRETWAAYMAQRKKDKKLAKCQRAEEKALLAQKYSFKPNWFQKLSCQQILYVEFLSTAIRLDSDENVSDRTYFVLGGLGLYPRPSRKVVNKCLKFCHYNALQFLNQLILLTKDNDPFNEKRVVATGDSYTWNEILLMNAVCHLELPGVLREIMDRMPPLPREPLLPQIPYPVFPKPKKMKYETPYDEPLWKESINWVEKNLIDKLNRARAHMETKRVKVPSLALVRRPSLIDNRPPFLAQIEANERASKRLVKEKPKKVYRKHPISTFNSAIDVTAIAGIEASEVSTTDKADTDDICVFLREPPKRQDVVEEDREQEELIANKEVKFTEDEEELNTQVNRIKDFSVFGEYSGDDDMSFKTPPKRESGTTIQSPCPPPDGTPGPPVTHYERAKREAGILKQELCVFHPIVSSSTQTVKEANLPKEEDIEEKLKAAAEKLKKFADEPDEEGGDKFAKKKKRKKRRSSKKRRKSKKRKKTVVEIPDFTDDGEEEEEEEEEGEFDRDKLLLVDEFVQEEEIEEFRSFRSRSNRSRKSSEISDPDPDPDAEWPPRPVCFAGEEEEEEKPKKKKKKKCKRKKCKSRKESMKKKRRRRREGGFDMVLREESEEYLKKAQKTEKEEKVTMTECYPGEFDFLYKEGKEEKETLDLEKMKSETTEVYTGDPMEVVKNIIADLAEEGFICASYSNLEEHMDVKQLIAHLQGRVLNQKFRSSLQAETKILWNTSAGPTKPRIPQINISPERLSTLTWNDKKWLSKIAKKKLDECYFNQAVSRATAGKELYLSLHQMYLGTDRYLKAYYAYMVSKYEDCVLKGID